MEKGKLYVLSLILIILSVIVGIIIGVLYQTKKNGPQIQSTETVIKNLSSKVVSAVVAYGTVTNIDSNRDITLSYGGDELTITIRSDAKINEYNNSVKQNAEYQDIKLGDLVNITADVLPNGKLEGNMVIVFAHNPISQ